MAETHEKRTYSSAALNACCFRVEENNSVAFAHTRPLFGEIQQSLEFVCRKATQANLSMIVGVVIALPDDVVSAEWSCLILAWRQQIACRHRFVDRYIGTRPFGTEKLKLCGKRQPRDRTRHILCGK